MDRNPLERVKLDLRTTKFEIEVQMFSSCLWCLPKDNSCKGCAVENLLQSLKKQRDGLFKKAAHLEKELGL